MKRNPTSPIIAATTSASACGFALPDAPTKAAAAMRTLCGLTAILLACSTAVAVPPAEGPKTATARVWQLDDPLYEELFSDEPAGLARDGALYWFHGMQASAFAQRFGMRFVYEEMYQLNAANKLLVFTNSGMLDSSKIAMPETARKTGMRFVLLLRQPFFADSSEVDTPTGYMTQLRDGLKHADVLWGVGAGDEAEHHNLVETIERLHDPKRVTPNAVH